MPISIFLGISVNITEADGLLTMTAVVPDIYMGNTSGLMGNFNGNPNDDFIKRGTSTSLPSNSTDREIFDFGKTCKNSVICCTSQPD